MKTTTRKIFSQFPVVEKAFTSSEEKNKISHTEIVFLNLARFFETPKEAQFNLSDLYVLESDWLVFALELVTQHFQKETYLLQDRKVDLIVDSQKLMNQTQLAEYFTSHGLPFDRAKINVYLSRNKLIEPSYYIGNIPYWSEKDAKKYLENKNKISYGME